MASFNTVDVEAVIPQQAVTVQLANTVKGELFLTVMEYSFGTSRISAWPISAMSRAELY